jgi:tRNA-methyltransferase O
MTAHSACYRIIIGITVETDLPSAPDRYVERVRGRRVEFTGVDMLDRTPVLDIKPWNQQLDIPGWPDRNVQSIRGGWYQRVDVVNAGGLLAGRQSLERAGMLRPQFQEDVS